MTNMLNKAPILLFCFSRGGSNIFWNFFLTHPSACSPIRETLEIFRFDRKGLTRNGFKLMYLTRNLRFMDQRNLRPRHNLSPQAQEFIDTTLHKWKLATITDEEMCYKSEGVLYTDEEVEHSRLVLKNNNGLVFLSDILHDMYDDAVSFALVRHPLALFESYKRRKFITSPEQFVAFYRKIAAEMLRQSTNRGNYHLVRFEDILAEPVTVLHEVYAQAHLDINAVEKIRLKAKAHLNDKGDHTSSYGVGKHYWLTFNEMDQFITSDINKYQIANLTQEEIDIILENLDDVMQSLGYGSEFIEMSDN